MAKNEGKLFEEDWKDSYEKHDELLVRLQDGAKWLRGGAAQSFTTENPCDSIGFHMPFIWFLELKSTKGSSFSFTPYGEDCTPYSKPKKRNGKKVADKMVKTNQVASLMKFSEHTGTICGLVLNFRERATSKETIPSETYFIHIRDFIKFAQDSKKGSINLDDCKKIGTKVEQRLKKVRYEYNIENFQNDTIINSVKKGHIKKEDIETSLSYLNTLLVGCA